jgi:hypothetical protein
MAIPGFTAESALYLTPKRYSVGGTFALPDRSEVVTQARLDCDRMSDFCLIDCAIAVGTPRDDADRFFLQICKEGCRIGSLGCDFINGIAGFLGVQTG